MRRRRSNSRRTSLDRRAAAVVEFAIVAPFLLLLVLLIFGLIEFGRLMMVQQVLTNGSREGARRAVLEQATSEEVEELAKPDSQLPSAVVGRASGAPCSLYD